MFKILGKPLLEHVINVLKEAGLKEFIVVTGEHAEQIKDYFEDGKNFGIKITYAHQEKPLGMADAIQTVKGLVSDKFLVVNAEDMFEPSLITEKIKAMELTKSDLILSCKSVMDTWKYGILKVTGDKVETIVEKPAKGEEPSNLAVVGVYILPKEIFDYYDKVPVSDSQHEQAIQEYINDGNDVRAVVYKGFFAAYKYPWDLFAINEYLMKKIITGQIIGDGVKISEKAKVEGNVWIGRRSRILENAVIKGPVYIGDDVIIGTNTLVRNFSSIDNKCVVGFSTEVNNSIIGEDCWFHSNYIGDSIIGDNCSFGSGAVAANFRFDEQTIKVDVGGEKIDSGRDKLGAIIGDNSKVGVNSTLSPGIKVGSNSIVGPAVCLMRNLDSNKIILINKDSYTIKENKLNLSLNKRDELRSRLDGVKHDRRI